MYIILAVVGFCLFESTKDIVLYTNKVIYLNLMRNVIYRLVLNLLPYLSYVITSDLVLLFITQRTFLKMNLQNIDYIVKRIGCHTQNILKRFLVLQQTMSIVTVITV